MPPSSSAVTNYCIRGFHINHFGSLYALAEHIFYHVSLVTHSLVIKYICEGRLVYTVLYVFCLMFVGIEPTTYSDGMISWFPIFFPLVVNLMSSPL